MEKNKPHYDWNHSSNTCIGVKYMNVHLPQLPPKVTTMTTVEKTTKAGCDRNHTNNTRFSIKTCIQPTTITPKLDNNDNNLKKWKNNKSSYVSTSLYI